MNITDDMKVQQLYQRLKPYLDARIAVGSPTPVVTSGSGGVSTTTPHALVGPDHIATGLTTGQVLRATGASTFDWGSLLHTDLGGVTADQHHATVTLGAGSHAPLALAGQALTLTMPSVLAGLGLSGGGVLSIDRTLAVNTSYAFDWLARHTFEAGETIAAGQTLGFGADVSLQRKTANTLQVGPGDALEADHYVSGIAGWHIEQDFAEFANVLVRGELRTSVFVKGLIEAHAGSGGYFKSAGTLAEPMWVPPSGTWTMVLKDPPPGGFLFDNSDVCEVKSEYGPKPNQLPLGLGSANTGSGIADTWFTVASRTDNGNGTQTYTCTWQYGTRAVNMPIGVGVVDWGATSGGGAITLSADGTIGAGPNISVITHEGTPWTTKTLQGRIGNLRGAYGVGSNDYYGMGVGDYEGGNYLRYVDDPTNTLPALVLKAGGGAFTIDPEGVSITAGTGGGNKIKFYASGILKASLYTNVAADSILYGDVGDDTNPGIFQMTVNGHGAHTSCQVDTGYGLRVDSTEPNPAKIISFKDGTTGGFLAGASADVQLYRGGANLWQTPDSLTVDAGLNVGSTSGAAAGEIFAAVKIKSVTGRLDTAATEGMQILNATSAQGLQAASLYLGTTYGALPANGTLLASGSIRSNTGFNINGTAGVSDTFYVLTDFCFWDGTIYKFKRKSLTFTAGLVTSISAESEWIDVPNLS